MTFKQTINTVYSLCIDLVEQGIYIEPVINIKRKEINLWFYDGFKNELPLIMSMSKLSCSKYTENPTESELKDGDIQGNYSSCLQFLQSLVRTAPGPITDLNEMYYNAN